MYRGTSDIDRQRCGCRRDRSAKKREYGRAWKGRVRRKTDEKVKGKLAPGMRTQQIITKKTRKGGMKRETEERGEARA